jgi:cytochrome c oxidase subunit II
MNWFQSATDPAGPYAGALNDLWWFFLIVCAVIWGAVLIGMVWSIVRGLRRTQIENSERSVWVNASMIATVITLISMVVVTTATGRAVSPHGKEYTREIQITGHQWWWDVQYLDARPDRIAQTANELHLPAGETVKLILKSADVIHSFWVPNLHGKRDLIPGDDAIFTIRADEPGIYRAQCAEFCGFQHAKMGFIVVVEPKAQFERWLANLRMPGRHPSTAEQQRGQQVFLMTTCAMCHAIKGTSAGARTGPDLTHIGSRQTLAAGILPNNRGTMAGWISDPGGVKPGVLMPPHAFDSDDLQALVAYMESLQ